MYVMFHWENPVINYLLKDNGYITNVLLEYPQIKLVGRRKRIVAIERYEKNIGTTEEGEPIIKTYEWEVCDECGERIPEDDAVWHYHAGTVISLEENNNA